MAKAAIGCTLFAIRFPNNRAGGFASNGSWRRLNNPEIGWRKANVQKRKADLPDAGG
jgi:hypothetical protein